MVTFFQIWEIKRKSFFILASNSTQDLINFDSSHQLMYSESILTCLCLTPLKCVKFKFYFDISLDKYVK